MKEGLEVYLDDPAVCADNPGRCPMWMRDCLREWFRLEPLKKMITRTIPKASTGRSQGRGQDQLNQPINWTNNRPTNQTTNQSNHQPTKIVHDCLADPTNNCSVKPKTIKNGYAKKPIGKTIYTSKQPRTIDWPSNWGQATHPRAIGLWQSKQLIWERLDCNQLTGQLIKQLVKHEYKYKHPPWNRSWSEVWIRG